MNKVLNKENSFDLNLKWHFPEGKKYAFTFITLFVALITIYGNSFHGKFHFDDYPNIINNENVHIESLSWKDIKKTFYGMKLYHGKMNRPLSYFTFALNYHFGSTNVFGYHVINFSIHYLAAIFLFLFIYNTLKLPVLRERYEKTVYSIALLSVFFWAAHPIQVTAVTYIVQRMASMAGMFYIMAMYFYLKGRTENGSGKKLIYFTLCSVAAIFSFASKENAAILPMSLLLYDLFLIQGLNSNNFKNNLKIAIFLLLITLFIVILFVDISAIFEGYKNRPFTLFERLLTEPRIILFYLTLLFYPMSFRLTLLHDIEISKSLLTPWTTLPAILIIIIIIAVAIIISRKENLIAYCILFFFLNHMIEGSVIPLELIFEHRNYIPSMFVFVPIAILCVHILDHFSYKKSIQLVMSFVIIFFIAAQGHTTYIRNNLFKLGIALWKDNIKKAPNLHRPRHNFADELLVVGFYEEGVYELKKSLNARAGARIKQKYKTHYNLGVYYLFNVEYDKALEHFYKTLKYIPNHPKTLNKIAIIKFCMNDLTLAENFIKKAISLEPDSREYHTTLSLILLKKGDIGKAIDEAKKGIDTKKNYLIGDAFRLKDNLTKSVYFFKRHLKRYPNQIPVNLALIELYYLLNKEEALKQRVLHLITLINDKELSEILLKFHNELNFLDYSRVERIICAIDDILVYQSDELNGLRQKGDLGGFQHVGKIPPDPPFQKKGGDF